MSWERKAEFEIIHILVTSQPKLPNDLSWGITEIYSAEWNHTGQPPSGTAGTPQHHPKKASLRNVPPNLSAERRLNWILWLIVPEAVKRSRRTSTVILPMSRSQGKSSIKATRVTYKPWSEAISKWVQKMSLFQEPLKLRGKYLLKHLTHKWNTRDWPEVLQHSSL